jgi:prepilin-type N-terminal cleavage/methylation domain-containing protein
MLNKKNKLSGFTLTELIIALSIIGAIAAMSIPSIIGNIQKRQLSVMIKNYNTALQQVINNQMIKYRTKNLQDTDFASATKLLTSSNFQIAKRCSASTATTDCWNFEYRAEFTGTTQQPPISDRNKESVVLKNGAVFSYTVVKNANNDDSSDPIIGQIYIDVNGSDKPNISGRDFFAIYITKYGKLTNNAGSEKLTNDEYLAKCKGRTASSYCYSYLTHNNWSMDY